MGPNYLLLLPSREGVFVSHPWIWLSPWPLQPTEYNRSVGMQLWRPDSLGGLIPQNLTNIRWEAQSKRGPMGAFRLQSQLRSVFDPSWPRHQACEWSSLPMVTAPHPSMFKFPQPGSQTLWNKDKAFLLCFLNSCPQNLWAQESGCCFMLLNLSWFIVLGD